MLDIRTELQSLLTNNSELTSSIEAKMEDLACTALKALEPIILAAIKKELMSLIGL